MEIIKNDGSAIELIRYFAYEGNKVLIFSNGDALDEQGHAIIHICFVDANNHVASAIPSDSMEGIRKAIRTIVTENNNGSALSISDLNYNDLNGLMVVSDWPLRMQSGYIDSMKLNQPVFDETSNIVLDNQSHESADVSVINQSFINNDQTIGISDQSTDLYNQQNIGNKIDFSSSDDGLQNNYQQMYDEQVELVSKLRQEIELYKNKIETIKNIVNN